MRKFIVSITSLALLVPAFAGTARAGKTTFHTLQNGMKVILKENHAVPLISSVIVVGAGSKFENEKNNGFTHLLEHMLFNGTTKRTREDINEGIKNYGGYINAFTRQEMTGYLVVMPKEFISEGLDIQSDQLFNSTLPPEEFPKERDIVAEEIKKDTDVESNVANDYFNSVVFSGTPYARPVIGLESTIRNVTREEVMTYYKKYYVPNNMTAFISGDFNTDDMLKLVQKYFGSFPAGESPELEQIDVNPPWGTEIHIKRYQSKVSYVNISVPGPLYTDPDYYAFDVLMQILDSDTSPLGKALLGGENPIATDLSVSIDMQKEYTMMNINIRTNSPENIEPVVDVATRILYTLPEVKFNADDIRRVVVANKVNDIKLEEKLHYYAIMKAPYIATAGFDFLQGYIPNLSKVTPADVERVCAKYFSKPKYVACALAPEEVVK